MEKLIAALALLLSFAGTAYSAPIVLYAASDVPPGKMAVRFGGTIPSLEAAGKVFVEFQGSEAITASLRNMLAVRGVVLTEDDTAADTRVTVRGVFRSTAIGLATTRDDITTLEKNAAAHPEKPGEILDLGGQSIPIAIPEREPSGLLAFLGKAVGGAAREGCKAECDRQAATLQVQVEGLRSARGHVEVVYAAEYAPAKTIGRAFQELMAVLVPVFNSERTGRDADL